MGLVRVKRSSHLVSYWDDGRLVFCNAARGVTVQGGPLVTYVLDRCTSWIPAAHVAKELVTFGAKNGRRLVDRLADVGLLLRSTEKTPESEVRMSRWGRWNPSASFFHVSTRNVPGGDSALAERELQERYAAHGSPPATKRYRSTSRVSLPRGLSRDDFSEALLRRRTWREFSGESLTLDQVAPLLGLSFGVQRTADSAGLGPVHLKTSPSAGARQPLEAYVLAVDVDGLSPGLYHYSATDHALERVRKGATPATVARYIQHQPWYEPAPMLFILTAVFERTQWKYDYPQAYRSVLLEAGHVCQTFCLAATWLGLAPFCTALFTEREVERDLRIDGISESFIYGGGVGRRPKA